MGEYVFSADDVADGRKFPDVVMRSAYPVDVHAPDDKGYKRIEAPPIKPGAPPPGDWYEVPYRSLVPLVVDNMLIAGRCVSATHDGQAAVRIMPNCMALGQAAGTAAALCAKKGVKPRSLDTNLLLKHLREQGALV